MCGWTNIYRLRELVCARLQFAGGRSHFWHWFKPQCQWWQPQLWSHPQSHCGGTKSQVGRCSCASSAHGFWRCCQAKLAEFHHWIAVCTTPCDALASHPHHHGANRPGGRPHHRHPGDFRQRKLVLTSPLCLALLRPDPSTHPRRRSPCPWVPANTPPNSPCAPLQYYPREIVTA